MTINTVLFFFFVRCEHKREYFITLSSLCMPLPEPITVLSYAMKSAGNP